MKGISYGTLGACYMWKILLKEERDKFWMIPWGEKLIWGQDNFGGAGGGDSDSRGHRGLAPSEKRHYNFLVPLF